MEGKDLALLPAERRRLILTRLQQQGVVRVSSLSEQLGVSEITIRRDLEQMEEESLLERTHGGAILVQRMRVEPRYSEKHNRCLQEKQRIGRACASMVEDGDTVFIHSGSTTLQIFRYLPGKKDVTVITSNAAAFLLAQELGEQEPSGQVSGGIGVVFVGGAYRAQSNSLVGPLAISSLNQVVANKAFIGVDGISLNYGLTTPTIQEAQVARTMIDRTKGSIIVAADHSKLGIVADYVSSPLDKISVLVTDSDAEMEFCSRLEELGIQVLAA